MIGARHLAQAELGNIFADALSSSKRLSKGRDCFEAQAPIWLPRARLAK